MATVKESPKRRGRPPSETTKGKSPVKMVKIAPHLIEPLRKRAAEERRSMTMVVSMAVEKYLGE